MFATKTAVEEFDFSVVSLGWLQLVDVLQIYFGVYVARLIIAELVDVVLEPFAVVASLVPLRLALTRGCLVLGEYWLLDHLRVLSRHRLAQFFVHRVVHSRRASLSPPLIRLGLVRGDPRFAAEDTHGILFELALAVLRLLDLRRGVAVVAALRMGVLSLLPHLVGLWLRVFGVVVSAIDLAVVEVLVIIVFMHRATTHHEDVCVLQIAYLRRLGLLSLRSAGNVAESLLGHAGPVLLARKEVVVVSMIVWLLGVDVGVSILVVVCCR